MPCLDIEIVATLVNTQVLAVGVVQHPYLGLCLCLQRQTGFGWDDGDIVGHIFHVLGLHEPDNLHVGGYLMQALADGTGIVGILASERGEIDCFLFPRPSDIAQVHISLPDPFPDDGSNLHALVDNLVVFLFPKERGTHPIGMLQIDHFGT